MKLIATIVGAFLLLTSASHAVTWRVVSVSVIVNQGGASVTKTTLTAKKYIEEAARRFGDTNLKNYFIGFRVDSGVVAVVHIPTETLIYNVVSGLNGGGAAFNGTNTAGTVAQRATVSSLNTDFDGFLYDKFTRNADGSLKGVSRLVIGGTGIQTIIGTIRTTAKTFEL